MTPLHGIGSRQDLPLPFWLVVTGAAIVLVVTFALLLFAWREPRYEDESGRPLPRLTRVVDAPVTTWVLRGVVAAIWLLAGVALVAGVDRIDNPVFGFIFVWVWVGLVPLSLLFGHVWRRTNPIRTLLAFMSVVTPSLRRRQPGRYSVRPAALGLAAFLFLELVQPDRTTLPVLRGYAAVWLIVLLFGALVVGRRWIAMADPFEVFASTIARMSPWGRTRSGQLMLTSPVRNLASWQVPQHLSWVCVVLLAGTAFDSFGNQTWWIQLVQNSPLPSWLWGTIGLLTMTAIVAVTYLAGCAGLRSSDRSLAERANLLAPGLVPIVAGYALAHYGTLLWLEGQRTALQFSDPLGRNWNLFGTAELGINTAIIEHLTLVACFQVLCIVGGHVLGVLVSHDIALRYLHTDRDRLLGQAPLMAVMVFYTCMGLVLMFAR